MSNKVEWNIEDDSYLFGKEERTVAQRARNYCVNDGPKLVFIIIMIAANVGCFLWKFLFYYFARYPGGVRPANGATVAGDAWLLFGTGVGVARGAAQALKLNCALILIPVLRNVLSWLRGTWLNNYLPLDKNIVFHRYLGWAILFWTLTHVTAHWFNFNAGQSSDTGLLVAGANPQPLAGQLAYTTLPGATGHIALLCLVLIAATAAERVRRPMFEVFWYTHHSFIIFYGVLLGHGFAKLLEEPDFWMWVIGPMVLYLIERIVRLARGSVQTIVTKAILHPSKVIELRLVRKDGKDFRYKSGQYFFLNSPFLAQQEWHPFTITSTPSDPYLSFHIREAGDWTGDLIKMMCPEKIDESELPRVIAEDMHFAPNGEPIMRVDGGFGAASEEVFDYENVVLVGAGIGVTPFASILKNIQHQLGLGQGSFASNGGKDAPLIAGGRSRVQKVHFFWINRNREAFEWFAELLAEMEATNEPGNPWLELNIYLTERIKDDQLKDFFNAEDGGDVDEITGLQSKTHYGRPTWDSIFLDLASRYRGQTTAVFLCGPKALSRVLYAQCRQHTQKTTNTLFKFNKENF